MIQTNKIDKEWKKTLGKILEGEKQTIFTRQRIN